MSLDIQKLPQVQRISFAKKVEAPEDTEISIIDLEPDSVEISNKASVETEPPKIGIIRLVFGRLSNEQIKQVNESGMLPKNAKFVMTGQGTFVIRPNFLNVVPGTRKLPEGFEVKKDVLGFTTVLPKGMKSILLKDAE